MRLLWDRASGSIAYYYFGRIIRYDNCCLYAPSDIISPNNMGGDVSYLV